MPYYSAGTRKVKTSRESRQGAKAHSRPIMNEPPTSKNHSKESIREVTLKLMALMKAKRECQAGAE